MKFVFLFLISALGLVASSSFAARSLPTYPATEEGPCPEVIASAPGYRGANPPSVVSAPVIPAPAPIALSRSEAPSVPRNTVHFDAVPSAQAEPLIRRLRLTEELISKYGRAYDYRELTVTELQTILAQLDAQAAQNAQFRARMNTRTAMKKSLNSGPATADEEIPAPSGDAGSSLGTEAPEPSHF